jgi:hypothetical protein
MCGLYCVLCPIVVQNGHCEKKIADGIKQGKTLEQIVDSNPTKEYVTVFDKTIFIQAVYDSLRK